MPDIRLELQVDGMWQPVPTYNRDRVSVETGSPELAVHTDPGSLSITINNRDGKYSPRNPLSPLYGKIGRNSRVRLSVPGGASFLELSGAVGGASTPDASALDITGDLDLRWEGEADWYATNPQMLIGKWDDSGLGRSYALRLAGGSLFITITASGTIYFGSFVLPALPRRAALRAVADLDSGGGNHAWRFYWAETMDGPWTEIGEVAAAPALPSPNNSTGPLLVSPQDRGFSPQYRPVQGRCYRAEVRNGIDGTVVAAPDFRDLPAGTSSFVDSAGRTWTVTAPAGQVRDREDLFTGEVSEWPQHWQVDGSDSWVTLQAAGILRRLGQGKKALQSTLRRRIPTFQPLAYWPLEEGAVATQAYSPIPGVRPATLTRVTWAGADTLPSSEALPVLAAGTGAFAQLSAPVPAPSGTLTSWDVQWIYRMDQAPTGYVTVMRTLTTGTAAEWYLQFKAGGIRVVAKNADGDDVFSQEWAAGDNLWNGWVHVEQAVTRDGSNVDFTYRIITVDGVGGDASGTFAGTIGRPTAIGSPPDGFAVALDRMAIGHISVWTAVAGATVAYQNAITAWTGETARDRLQRLADEESLPLAITHGDLDPEQVGPQTVDTLLTLLQAAADADGGILGEDPRRIGLVYRERSTMYSQEPALTLSYDQAPGLAAPLEPTDDDQDIRNDRTVQRDGGSSAHAVLEEGPLSVQEPPDGVGRYDDSVTLSLYSDAQCEPIAYWRLALGTVDTVRYPSIKVLLHKAPNLIPAVLGLRHGDLVRLTDLPLQVGGGTADLIVQGIHHEMTLTEWTVTLTTSPGQPWQVATTDDPLFGRVDTDGSELAAAATTTATNLPITATAGPNWTTDPAEYPFDITVGGEVCTATACTAPAATPMPAATASSATAATSAVAPSLTAPAASGLLVCAWLPWADGAALWTVPAGMTVGAQTTGEWSVLADASQPVTAAGATGTRTATRTVAAARTTLSVLASGDVQIEQYKSGKAIDTANTHNPGPVALATDAGTEAGWWLLALHGWDNAFSASGGGPVEAGWTQLAISGYGNANVPFLGAWAKKAAGGAETVTFNAFDCDDNHSRLYVLSGAVDLTAQVMTVTRAVNGISKNHLAGEAASLAQPATVAL